MSLEHEAGDFGSFVDAPGDMLFSLATVCADDPPVVRWRRFPWQPVCTMHEDDWRQIEFASADLAPTIEKILLVLREMRQQHAQRVNDEIVVYSRLFERAEPKQPLRASSLSFANLLDSLRVCKVCSRLRTAFLAHKRPTCVIENGFAAITAGGSRLYGVVRGDLVDVLGLMDVAGSVDEPLLHAFAKRNKLVLVNWNRATCAGPQDAHFKDLLT